MLRRSVSLVPALVLAGVFQAGPVLAQVFTPPDARFLAEAPEIGEMVPDLAIVDGKGDPVHLRELTRGHYTVLTLGCLT